MLPTRFELVLLDSKSNVLTTTLWKQKLNNRVQDSHPFRFHCMSLYQNHKICFIDEADYLSKSSQASLRGVIEETSINCRYIFTVNDMSKIHNALCSRMMPLCFDMSPAQIEAELEKYKVRIISMLKANHENIDEQRIFRLIDMNFPDYRTISNKIEFEML